MSDKDQNAHLDPDRQLARHIGDALPDFGALKKTSDPFLEQLVSFKEHLTLEEAKAEPVRSDELWNAIDGSISTSQSRPARILSFTPAVRKYAVAAAVLLMAFIGVFFYQSQPSQTLVAESFMTVKSLTLSDGSEVTLRPYSKLYEIENQPDKATYQLTGEGYFEVISNPNRVFSVKAGLSEVQVLGTKFMVSDWGDVSKVYLQEGRIQYTNLSNKQSVTLAPGQSSFVDKETETPSVSESEEHEFTDWMNNELVFKNESVRAIFDELQQQFNIRIEASQSVLSNNLSGSIQLGELPAVLSDLELVLQGSFTQTGPNSYVFNSDNE